MMQTISSGVGCGAEFPARPPITILQSEADALADLALSPNGKSRLAAQLLLQELDRARTAKAGKLPNDVVSMGSYVLFVDELSQTRHSVQLVYPSQADIAFGRVSVLALIGAGHRLARPKGPLPTIANPRCRSVAARNHAMISAN